MTRKITVSLPDDLAATLEGHPNASARVALALQRLNEAEHTAQLLLQHGFPPPTPAGRQRARRKLAQAARDLTPERRQALRDTGRTPPQLPPMSRRASRDRP